jgi:ribose 5-phosphate isomerase B
VRPQKVVIGSDHRGFQLKSFILSSDLGLEFEDVGCFSEDPVDYPDIVEIMSTKIQEFGILICNTGIGMSIAANSTNNLSAALCLNQDMAYWARAHNNANILVLGAKYIEPAMIHDLVTTFIYTAFDQKPKNIDRLKKIRKLY